MDNAMDLRLKFDALLFQCHQKSWRVVPETAKQIIFDFEYIFWFLKRATLSVGFVFTSGIFG